MVTVTRIGPTVFHVRPGSSVPPQPLRHYPNFVVDTVAPARVAYWGQNRVRYRVHPKIQRGDAPGRQQVAVPDSAEFALRYAGHSRMGAQCSRP